MRRSERWFGLAVTVVMGVVAIPSNACSVRSGYRVPTNLELVAQAKVVAVVEVLSAPTEFGDHPFEPAVKVRAVRLLKGRAPDADLTLTGVSGWNGRPVPSVVTPLGESHFSAGLGACIRMFYRPGETVLAMYGRTDGKLHQIGQPFSHSAESVDSVADLWVRVAECYVAITQGDATTLDDRVRSTQAALRRQPGVEAAATVEDLERYLDRKTKRRPGWGGANGPDDAAAVPFTGDDRRPAAGLICGRDGRFGLISSEAKSRLALRIGNRRFETGGSGDPLREEEQRSFAFFADGSATPTIFRFEAPDAVLAALQDSAEPAAIEVAGVPASPMPPGDTLYRFAVRCTGWR